MEDDPYAYDSVPFRKRKRVTFKCCDDKNAEIDRLRAELAIKSARIAELEQRCSDETIRSMHELNLRKELATKDARIAEVEKRNAVVQWEYSQASTERGNYHLLNEALRKELAEAKAIIGVTDDTIQRVHAELAEAAKVVRKCHDERNAAVAELATLAARIASEEDKRRTAEWSRDHERTDNDALRKELAAAKAIIAAKDARIAELEAKLKQYDRPVAIPSDKPEPPHNVSGWPGEDM